MEGILSLILTLYSLLMVYYHHSLKKLLKSVKNEVAYNFSVDVVIVFRNEEGNLPNLLRDLDKLSFTDCPCIFHFINDHSTDKGGEMIDRFIENSPLEIRHYKLLSSLGKKAAIQFVLPKLSSDWILFTDADCKLQKDWITSFVQKIAENPGAECVLGPVALTGEESVFHQLQRLEFMSLQASTAASCLTRNPIMSNGANWMVKRLVYLEVVESIKGGIASGDDMFVLHAIKKRSPDKIVYNGVMEAVVKTSVSNLLTDFWQQRMRWTAKSKYYKDFTTIVISTLVLAANLSVIMALVLVWSTTGLVWFILAKLGSEFLVLQRYANYYEERDLLKVFPLLSILYPLYIILIVGSAIFVKFQWKGRSYKA